MAEATYFLSVRESTVGANKRHLSVFNGVGSGVTLRVYQVRAAGSPVAVVSGLIVALACVKITGHSVGTGSAVSGEKADSGDLNVPAQLTAFTGSTVSGLATTAWGLGSVNTDDVSMTNESVLYQAPIDGSKPVTLHEGEGFCVTQGTLAGAGAVSLVAIVGIS